MPIATEKFAVQASPYREYVLNAPSSPTPKDWVGTGIPLEANWGATTHETFAQSVRPVSDLHSNWLSGKIYTGRTPLPASGLRVEATYSGEEMKRRRQAV
jgi:hypothetical protein